MALIDVVAIAWTLLALLLVPFQLRVAAPYGRHAHTGWGPSIPNRLGWFLMELVSLVVFVGLFLSGPAEKTAPSANLIPRALSHHAWYRRTFDDYPADRRAVIPSVL